MSEDRLSRLEAAMAAQQRQIDQLRVENQALRREAPLDSAPTSTDPSSAAADGVVVPGPLGRRSLLTKGLAAAGAATAGAILLNAEPAAAANGQALLIGGNNFGTAATRLNVAAPGTDGGLQIIDGGGLGSLGGYKPAIVVRTSGAPLDTGIDVRTTTNVAVRAWSDTYGLDAQGNAVGVIAASERGIGLDAIHSGTTVAGLGVRATSLFGTGIEASGTTYGVQGEATQTAGVGVLAKGPGMALKATGRVGAELDAYVVHLQLRNSRGNRTDPNEDGVNHERGDIVETTTGDLWLCTTAGLPGTWRKLAGPATAGAFHVLPAPARVYDSRPGMAPTAVGPRTPFTAGTRRTFDLKANSSGVPAGATAAMVTLLLVNAASGSGNLTIWANGAPKPLANTMVWGGSAGRFATTAVTALDSTAKVQVDASARTDLVIDVVGYYR